ncbi:MAG: glycoside hydrolase family 127 protein [Planctomycetota bacterium]
MLTTSSIGSVRQVSCAGRAIRKLKWRWSSCTEPQVRFEHNFSGVPFTSREDLNGHAVCALYTCCGATDSYLETGNKATWQTLTALWHDLTRHKMYVTGGVGSRPSNEEIGNPYELPNERGYAETCAAIGNIMWNWRLLNTTGQARFADVMELALYNGFLSGVSIDGKNYFYWNPLSSRSNAVKEQQYENEHNLLALKKSTGISLDIRQPYYRTPCCIPNAQRMIASLPGYMYSTSIEGLWVHLYHSSRLNWHLQSGKELTVTQSSAYPWENTVEIMLESAPGGEFSLFLRIPYWTASAKITVNEQRSYVIRKPGSYHEIRRNWNTEDRVKVAFEMPIRAIYSNPNVRENRGRVALQRGPVIYCLESVDHQNISVFDIVLPFDLSDISDRLEAEFEPDTLGGVVTIKGNASAYDRSLANERLYSFTRMKAIPYFAWANRGPSEMTVWIPRMRSE